MVNFIQQYTTELVAVYFSTAFQLLASHTSFESDTTDTHLPVKRLVRSDLIYFTVDIYTVQQSFCHPDVICDPYVLIYAVYKNENFSTTH
jgi:hypothetical protein